MIQNSNEAPVVRPEGADPVEASSAPSYIPVTLLMSDMERLGGKWTQKSREYMAECLAGLPDGRYDFAVKSKNPTYRNTRYKYYFGHLLEVILLTCGKMFEVSDGEGWRPLRTTEELHDCLKLKYNPVFVRSAGGVFVLAKSTTSLSDSDFIAKFEEAIVSEFSGPPFFCEFMTRQEYALFMKAKNGF